MVGSELVKRLLEEFSHLPAHQVETAVKDILRVMVETLSDGGRIEIRGFGTWCLRHRGSRNAHNPRTGRTILTKEKFGVYFKAGKALREIVNEGRDTPIHGARKGEGSLLPETLESLLEAPAYEEEGEDVAVV